MNRNITSKVVDYFEDKPVLKAYLFGSYARSETNKDSNIDILVELDYSRSIGLKFVKMQLDLQEILNRKVDLITEKGISQYIKPNVDKDKILIYEKQSR
jgi:predicted nucleotidyltransferase